MLPYTNADANAKSKFKSKFKQIGMFDCASYAAHALHSMSVSSKLLLASIASCINGIIPRAFKYTAMSICLSIIEDNLQNNRMPGIRSTSSMQPSLHDINTTDIVLTFAFDQCQEKME